MFPSMKTGRFASGLLLVAQNLFNRYRTPRGTLRGKEEEQSYGLDLLELIGDCGDEQKIASLPQRMQQEGKKDERITKIDVKVTPVNEGPSVSLDIIVSAETDTGPFELTIKASPSLIQLLKIVA